MATRRPLHHPIFLGALLLLVLNDHVFKGAGILPSWLTGKLSDFAGLIVAPIVLVSLLRLKSRTSILVAHMLIGVVFAMAEMSQGMADHVASLWRIVGIDGVRMWADWTDLWALCVLPIPFSVLTTTGAEAKPQTHATRASLALALMACIATSPPFEPSWQASGFVVNRTRTVRDVRLSWTSASLDCEALAASGADLGRIVQPEIFTRSLDFQVGLDVTLPLDESEALRAAHQVNTVRGTDAGPPSDAGPRADAGPTVLTARCELVLVHTEGFPDHIVLLDSTTMFIPESSGGRTLDETRALRFTESAFEVGSALITTTPVSEDAPSTCTAARGAISLEPTLSRSRQVLTAATPRADGCLELTFSDSTGASMTSALCGVPSELFPFTVGSMVLITTAFGTTTISDDSGALSFEVRERLSSAARTLEPCNGERLACGGFVIPAASSGPAITTRTSVDGMRVRTFQGRAESVLVGLPGCEPSRRVAGIHDQTTTTTDRQ